MSEQEYLQVLEDIKSKIRTVPNFPKEGIMFRDVTTLLKDSDGFKLMVDDFYRRYKDKKIDAIVGVDSRGFIIGGALAYLLGVGFVPVRKKGKLPADVISEEYALEYGTDILELHKDAITDSNRVVIVDDLIATGGTALAAGSLVKRLGGQVVEFGFIVDLPDIGGSEKLKSAGYSVYAQTSFDGD